MGGWIVQLAGPVVIGVHRIAVGIEEDRTHRDLPLTGSQRRLLEGEPHRLLEGRVSHHRYTKGLGGIA